MNNYFLLGIDYGQKKSGLAIGQSITKSCRPLKIIYNNLLDEIEKAVLEWDIKIIIIGYPEYKKEGQIQKKIKLLSEEIKTRINTKIKIILHNEALTSEMAKSKFKEMRNKGLTKKKLSDYDDISASIILQSWVNENIID
jgi:putative Holliday junction resolvase